MPAPTPVRRALAGEGVSLARLISVVVMVLVIALSLRCCEAAPRCFPGPRERWGWRGKSGFAGTLLHGAGAQRRRRKLGGSLFGGEKGQSPSAPLYAASAAMTRVSDESPSGPRRRLPAGSGQRPPARPRRGDTPMVCPASFSLTSGTRKATCYRKSIGNARSVLGLGEDRGLSLVRATPFAPSRLSTRMGRVGALAPPRHKRGWTGPDRCRAIRSGTTPGRQAEAPSRSP